MRKIIPQITKTSELVKEISAASIEQNSGADQVNNAIQQLNNVTQQNAASSEELATSAEEMSSQAEQLKDIMSFFKIDIKNRTSSELRPNLDQTSNSGTSSPNQSDLSIDFEGNGHEADIFRAEDMVAGI